MLQVYSPTQSKKITLWLTTMVYFAIIFLGVLQHELWLDEAHHWLLARDSKSLQELWYHTRSEGHPILWNLLLYLLSRFTDNPISMQLLHAVICSTTVFILLRSSPFKWWINMLILASYFFIFEYALLSRNYSLGILFFVMGLSLWTRRQQVTGRLFIFLAIMLNCHSVFVCLALPMFLLILLEGKLNVFRKPGDIIKHPGVIFFVISLLLMVFQVTDSSTSWYFTPADGSAWQKRIYHAIISLEKGLIPMPDFGTHTWWNTHFTNAYKLTGLVLSLTLMLLPLFIFGRRRPGVYLIFCFVMLFVYVIITQRDHYRICGIYFLATLSAFWIDKQYGIEHEPTWLTKNPGLKSIVFVVILLLQIPGGIISYYKDYSSVFDSGKEINDYIRQKKLDKYKLVSFYCENTVVSAYSKQPIYAFYKEDYCSYCDWNSIQSATAKEREQLLLKKVENLLKREPGFLLLTSEPFLNTRPQAIKSLLLKSGTPSIVGSKYHLYLCSAATH